VIVALVQVVSAKLRNDVVPPEVGICETVSVFPVAVYPAPTTSLAEEYDVVAASKLAAEVYNAILYTLVVPVVKFCVPLKMSTLNDVHIACEIAIKNS
jgi:hypothetical protein